MIHSFWGFIYLFLILDSSQTETLDTVGKTWKEMYSTKEKKSRQI